jgi:hypothetical protein
MIGQMSGNHAATWARTPAHQGPLTPGVENRSNNDMIADGGRSRLCSAVGDAGVAEAEEAVQDGQRLIRDNGSLSPITRTGFCGDVPVLSAAGSGMHQGSSRCAGLVGVAKLGS